MITAFAPEILRELEEKAQGVFFLSETDSPFKVYSCNGNELLPQYLYTLSNRTSSDPCEEVSLSYLFKNVNTLQEKNNPKESENTVKYEELMNFLVDVLKEVKVYKLGDTHEDIFITGSTSDGQCIILATKAVETA